METETNRTLIESPLVNREELAAYFKGRYKPSTISSWASRKCLKKGCRAARGLWNLRRIQAYFEDPNEDFTPFKKEKRKKRQFINTEAQHILITDAGCSLEERTGEHV